MLTPAAIGLIAGLAFSTPASTLAPQDDTSGQPSTTLLADGSMLRLGGAIDGRASDRAVLVDVTGHEQTLGWSLRESRVGHTATMLADGRIAIIGGVDANGQLTHTIELVDPAVGVIEQFDAPGDLRRVYHTATTLMSGAVLVVGGQDSSGQLVDSGLWLPNDRVFQPWHVARPDRRSRHTATLDAGVLVTGGMPANLPGQQYDLDAHMVVDQASAESNVAPVLAESIPPNGATDVPVEGRIALRFSKPIRPLSLRTGQLELSGPVGVVTSAVIVAEGGRLVFVTPAAPLEGGSAYVLTVAGLQDVIGEDIQTRSVSFTTTGVRQPTTSSSDDEESGPGAASPWRSLPPLTAPAGVTALSGQVLQLSGTPLSDMTLGIDGQRVRTDRAGRFLLTNLAPGHRVLHIDGRTASRPGRQYGTYEAGVEVLPGRTSPLPYTIWMTRLDIAHAVRIPSPTTTETVITTPRLPGLELRLPSGTVIRDEDGNAVREISITPIPIDRPPFPLPAGVRVPIYFTIQPGGAYLHTSSGASARLIYPNTFHQPVGTVFDFWNYDAAARGWYVYGNGAVVPPGPQVVPNPGVGIYEFTGAMVANPNVGGTAGPPAPGCSDEDDCDDDPGPPDDPPPCDDCDPDGGDPPDAGDPVNLATGIFVLRRIDVKIADTLPLRLNRVYRSNDSMSRGFGIGASHNFDVLLLGDTPTYSFQDVVLPTGTRIHYVRITPGTDYASAVFEHTATTGRYYKSRIAWNGTAWELRFVDGTVYTFPNSNGQTAPAKAAIVALRDRYGNKITFKRDANGNLTQLISPNGRSLTFAYDASNRITSVTDNIGRMTQYTYDSSGRLATVTDPDSLAIHYGYDASNRMTSIQDRRATIFLTNDYDTSGRVWRQTRSDQKTYVFTYSTDGSGKITQTDVTDPLGVTRRVAFNSSGYITSDIRALGTTQQQTTSFVRDATSNLVTSITDPLGRVTTRTFDIGGVTSVTKLAGTPNAVTTTFTYDVVHHRLASVTDPLSHTTSFLYDAYGNVTAIVDMLGHRVSAAYLATGQLSSVTDPLLHSASFGYDNGDLTQTTDAMGGIRRRFTDAVGRTTAVIDALGRTATIAYDAIDRVVQTIDPLAGATTLSYDPNGSLLSYTDANGHATTFVYDSLDQIQTRTDPLNHADAYVFDAAGRLVQHTDRNGQVTTYTRDPLGRVSNATFSDLSTIAYTYDGGNRVTQIVDSNYGTISRTYDDLNRLTSETSPQGTVSYTYDAAGRRASLTVAGQTEIDYTYDSTNRLTAVTQGSMVVSLTYDGAGRRITATYPNGVVAAYAYDGASRLTGLTYTAPNATVIGTLTYSYDSNGRRTTVGGTLAATVLPAAVTGNYDAANRLVSWGTATPTYDLAGNLTNDGTNTYVWNARNQLASMGGGATASFAYDPNGRRASRTVAGTLTRVLYDGVNAVQELDGSGPTANLLTGLGIDETFVRADGTGSFSLLADALGSVVALTDSAGATTTQYLYGPFGDTAIAGEPSTNAQQFTGREKDGTGLLYLRERYYSASLGRFISEDPVGHAAGPNQFAYVGDNPTNLIDSFGLKEQNPNQEPSRDQSPSVGAGSGPPPSRSCYGSNNLSATVSSQIGDVAGTITTVIQAVSEVSLSGDMAATIVKSGRTGIGGSSNPYASGFNYLARLVSQQFLSSAAQGSLTALGDVLTPVLAVAGAFSAAYDGTIFAQCALGAIQ